MHSTFPKTIIAFLAILVSIVCVHSATTHAAGNNIAEDNFQRPHTTVGWGTTTNKSDLINYPWQRSLGTSNNSYIQSKTGIIVYAGTNGHKIAGYVGVPAQLGGDALAKITFTSVEQAVGGVTLQVRGGMSMNHSQIGGLPVVIASIDAPLAWFAFVSAALDASV